MSINAKLCPLTPTVAGLATLQVRGWEEDAGHLEFAIQRNQDEYYLQHDRRWGNAPCWFAQHFVENASGDSISCQVGAEIVDPLLLGSANDMYNFRLRNDDGVEDDNPLIILLDGLLPSLAGNGSGPGAAESTVSLSTTPASAPVPTVEPASAVEQISTPAPAQADSVPSAPASAGTPEFATTSEPKRGKVLPLLGLLILLLALAGGLWFWLRPATVPAPDAPAAAAPAAPIPTPAAQTTQPCSKEALANESELSFVQNCIKKSPDSDALLQIIAQAKDTQHCGVAQRLYANRAQAGDMKVAAAYAREYDPKYHQPSACFAEPDNATAAYWYEHILSYEPNNEEAAQRLQELKP